MSACHDSGGVLAKRMAERSELITVCAPRSISEKGTVFRRMRGLHQNAEIPVDARAASVGKRAFSVLAVDQAAILEVT